MKHSKSEVIKKLIMMTGISYGAKKMHLIKSIKKDFIPIRESTISKTTSKCARRTTSSRTSKDTKKHFKNKAKIISPKSNLLA
jgi:hypothetical protein